MSTTRAEVAAAEAAGALKWPAIFGSECHIDGDALLAGVFPRVLFPPLWCFPPRCAGAVPPCGLLTRS